MKQLFIVAAALLVFACNQNKTAQQEPATPQQTQAQAQAQTHTPEQLGEIGALIKKHPKDATKILSEHGLTEASFEKEIRQVASDPAASRRYRDAYKKAV